MISIIFNTPIIPQYANILYMKTEFETRFLDINKEDLISKLKALGATNKGEVKLNEIIFYDKDLKWLDEHKLVKLRKKNNSIKLIFKSNKEQTADSAKEIEFEVPNFTETKEFLEAIGLVPYRIVEKYRHTFEFQNIILDIDTWPKIPTYVEFEGNSVDELQKAAKTLGFDWEDRFDGDPRFVYKKYGFDFDNIKIVTFDEFK